MALNPNAQTSGPEPVSPVNRVNAPKGIALAFMLLVACGGRAYPIERVVEGEVHEGVFVSPYAYEHFMRAELAVAAGDDETALGEYALARTGPADDAYVIARQAAAALRLGRMEEVEALISSGNALDAESEPIALLMGRVAERQGNYDEASEHYERAHRFAPNSSEPAQRLAMLLSQSEKAAEVLDEITQSASRPVALRARLALAIHRRDAPLAAESALALMGVAPVFATELLATARTQVDEGRPMMALRLLEHPALNVEATMPLRVRAFAATGQQEAARSLVLSRAASASPSQRAHWWWLSGDADLALPEAIEAIAGGDVEANYWAGLSAAQLGDAAASARYLALVPESSQHHAAAAAALSAALVDAGP